jgi:succinate-acetate transporter protein
MAVGNTFGATALSSYGGFWLSLAIVLTPGGFDIVASYEGTGSGVNDFNNAFGYFLMGWFIFTTILLLCTLRSTLAFFLLFFTLDLAFLFLGAARLTASSEGVPSVNLNKAGGYFGIFAAFLAWYNALAGIADDRYDIQFLSPSSYNLDQN